MAQIAPFRGLRYDSARTPDLAAVLAPPYDVIGDGERRALEARDPHNVVRIELPRGEDDARYTGAAGLLSAWTSEGILRDDADDACYVYEQEFSWAGKRYTRRGFFAAGAIIDGASAGAPAVDATTPDGVRHRLWTLADGAAIARLAGVLADKQILIADGHHRYETMLGLSAELRPAGATGPAPSDFAMMYLARAEDPGLLVLPTHRLVKDLVGFDFAGLCAAAKAAFDITGGDERTPEAIEARLARDGAARVVFAVRVPGESATTWFALKPIVDLSALGPPSLRKLDVTVLHGVILGSLLGIDAEALAKQSFLTYTHDTKEAIARVAASEAQAAFLMNPTKVGEVLAACEAGFVLPQKSTYFQPKLATGLCMYRLDGPTPRAPR